MIVTFTGMRATSFCSKLKLTSSIQSTELLAPQCCCWKEHWSAWEVLGSAAGGRCPWLPSVQVSELLLFKIATFPVTGRHWQEHEGSWLPRLRPGGPARPYPEGLCCCCGGFDLPIYHWQLQCCFTQWQAHWQILSLQATYYTYRDTAASQSRNPA
jgi:hypothetical protein